MRQGRRGFTRRDEGEVREAGAGLPSRETWKERRSGLFVLVRMWLLVRRRRLVRSGCRVLRLVRSGLGGLMSRRMRLLGSRGVGSSRSGRGSFVGRRLFRVGRSGLGRGSGTVFRGRLGLRSGAGVFPASRSGFRGVCRFRFRSGAMFGARFGFGSRNAGFGARRRGFFRRCSMTLWSGSTTSGAFVACGCGFSRGAIVRRGMLAVCCSIARLRRTIAHRFRPGSCGDVGPAVVHGGEHGPIGASGMLVLNLRGGHLDAA